MVSQLALTLREAGAEQRRGQSEKEDKERTKGGRGKKSRESTEPKERVYKEEWVASGE